MPCQMPTAEEALELLRSFFVENDKDGVQRNYRTQLMEHTGARPSILKFVFAASGSGSLDREELADVVKRFYKEEKVSRKLSLVQEEVDDAIARFDVSGDGQLQFDEFIDVACLSDCFKFKMDSQIKLAVRSRVIYEKDLKWKEELLAEQKAMLSMDTNDKVTTLEKQVGSLSSRLNSKGQEATMLEELLQEQKGIIEKQTKQIRDAGHEFEECMKELGKNRRLLFFSISTLVETHNCSCY